MLLDSQHHEQSYDEEHKPSARSVAAEPPVMQVSLSHVTDPKGVTTWHRLTIDRARPTHGDYMAMKNARTACGKSVTGYYGMREESYLTVRHANGIREALCTDGCFTAFELELSAAEAKAEIEAEAERSAESDRKWQDDVKKAAERRLERETGRHPRQKKTEDP